MTTKLLAYHSPGGASRQVQAPEDLLVIAAKEELLPQIASTLHVYQTPESREQTASGTPFAVVVPPLGGHAAADFSKGAAALLDEVFKRGDEAVLRLEKYIAELGRPGAQQGKWARTEAERMRLQAASAAAAERRRMMQPLLERRGALRLQAERLRREWAELAEVQSQRRAAASQEFQEEEQQLREKIDAVTQQCFALSHVREFDCDQEDALRALLNQRAAAMSRAEHAHRHRAEVEAQTKEMRARLGRWASETPEEVGASMEKELNRTEQSLIRTRDRFEQFEEETKAARERLENAREEVNRFPDYDALGSDPLGRLIHFQSSLEFHEGQEAEEQQVLDGLREEVAVVRREVERYAPLFERMGDVGEAVRQYEKRRDDLEIRRAELSGRLDQESDAAAQGQRSAPALLAWSLLPALLCAGLVGAGIYWENWNVLLPTVLTAFAALLLAANAAALWARTRRLRAKTEHRRRELEELESALGEHAGPMETVLEEAGCSSLRELEALHDRHKSARVRLTMLQEREAAQEQRVEEARQAVERGRGQLGRIVGEFGVDAKDLEDAHTAVDLARAQHSNYLAAQRRLREAVRLSDMLTQQLEQASRAFESIQAEHKRVSLEVRETLRRNDYAQEARQSSAVRALAGYRERRAEILARKAALDELEDQLRAAAAEEMAALEARESAEEELAQMLQEAGVESEAEWREKADQARQYRALWEQRAELRDALEALAAKDPEARKRDVMNQSRAAEIDKGLRELEQDLAALENRLRRIEEEGFAPASLEEGKYSLSTLRTRLKLERDAAARAAAEIEELMRDRRQRLRRNLAAEINGVMTELEINAQATIGSDGEWRLRLKGASGEEPSAEAVRIAYAAASRTAWRHADELPGALVLQGCLDALHEDMARALIRRFMAAPGPPVVVLTASGAVIGAAQAEGAAVVVAR